MDDAVNAQMDAAVDMLFDENGKFGIPPGLIPPQLRLLSACISRELLRRNVKRALRDAEGARSSIPG
jgi:hypothetical protein